MGCVGVVVVLREGGGGMDARALRSGVHMGGTEDAKELGARGVEGRPAQGVQDAVAAVTVEAVDWWALF